MPATQSPSDGLYVILSFFSGFWAEGGVLGMQSSSDWLWVCAACGVRASNARTHAWVGGVGGRAVRVWEGGWCVHPKCKHIKPGVLDCFFFLLLLFLRGSYPDARQHGLAYKQFRVPPPDPGKILKGDPFGQAWPDVSSAGHGGSAQFTSKHRPAIVLQSQSRAFVNIQPSFFHILS